jgi:hypothetical protein
MSDRPEDEPSVKRAQQNARGSIEDGGPVAQLLYRLMRDHGISPDSLAAHVAECRAGKACYTNKALGAAAVQAAEALEALDHNPDGFVHASPEVAAVISEAVAKHMGVGAWDGAFSVAKQFVHINGDPLAVVINDATGATFAVVQVHDAVGSKDGAKARATQWSGRTPGRNGRY